MLMLSNITVNILRAIEGIDNIGDVTISGYQTVASGIQGNLQPIAMLEDPKAQGTLYSGTHLLIIDANDLKILTPPVITDIAICSGKSYDVVDLKRDLIPAGFPKELDTYRLVLRASADK
jgi:hypothetical protein